jgi:DNA-binding CsgD family transcriptional regulator
MSSPISSQFPNAPPVGKTAEAPAPAPNPQPVVRAQGDTVDLTLSQRVYLLHTQGQRVSQIASSLNLSEAAVNSYLNISTKR